MSQTDMHIARGEQGGIFMRRPPVYSSGIALAHAHSKLSAEEYARSLFESDRVITFQRKIVSAIAIIEACAMIEVKKIGRAANSACIYVPYSAGVEHACSSHKVVPLNSRNRLKNAEVQKLVFTYIIPRILPEVASERGNVFNDEDELNALQAVD